MITYSVDYHISTAKRSINALGISTLARRLIENSLVSMEQIRAWSD